MNKIYAKLIPAYKINLLNIWICLSFMVLSPLTYANNGSVTDAGSDQTTPKRKITGVVTDNYGEPIIGANIVLKNNKAVGTITDIDGKYTIEVAGSDVLLFNYVGYEQQEIRVGDSNTINVQLRETSVALDEVQIIAYGTQKKVTLTGSVSSVNTDQLLKSPSASVGNILAGTLSGITTVQYSGQPGAEDPEIFVRGTGSLDASRSKPLIMVDGVERSFFRMDPNEIENVTVLKDASATAVFGVRGANGVILVTTKRGTEGPAKITLSSSVGIVEPLRIPEMVGSYEYVTLHNEMRKSDGMEVIFKPKVVDMFRTGADPIMFPDTNWRDMLFTDTSLQTQHNITLTGGTKRVKYFASLGYLYQDGILKKHYESYDPNYKDNRYNYRLNLDINVTNTTLLKINAGGISETRREPNTESANNLWWEIFRAQTFSSPGFINGKVVRNANTYYSMGLRDGFFGYYGKGYRSITENTMNLDLTLTQKLDAITQGLSVEVKGTYNFFNQYQKTWSGSEEVLEPIYMNSITNPSVPFESENFTDREIVFRQIGTNTELGYSENYNKKKTRDWYLEASLRYDRVFGDHAVTGLFLYNQSKKYYMANYPIIPRSYMGIVGRATYSYKYKYLLDVNVGYNGSENFAEKKRFGTFPSASLGWNISEEKFMENLKFIDLLKLRASYGLVGNDRYLISDNDVRFLYVSGGFNPNTSGYNFGVSTPENVIGARELMLGNPEVTWETAAKQNYGIDITMLGQRLNITADLFFEKRKDILIQRNTIPNIVAAQMPVVNMGKVNNRGYEISIGWNDKVQDFRYWAKYNMSFARNKVIYKDEVPVDQPWQISTGKRMGMRMGYMFDRFFEEGDFNADGSTKEGIPLHSGTVKPGDLMYQDLNGDKVIDDKDRALHGYADRPEYVFGLVSGFEYKNLDFSMTWTAATNVSREIKDVYRNAFGNGEDPLLRDMADGRWTPEKGQSARYPRFTITNKDHNRLASSFWIKDASYLRLKNIEIGYSLTPSVLKTLGIESVRFYVNAYNLLTFDHLKTIDPEQLPGASNNKYPLTRIYNFGVNINF